eukprot:scaffold1252_cov154-Amphora_coffeaeformis.AAC.8
MNQNLPKPHLPRHSQSSKHVFAQISKVVFQKHLPGNIQGVLTGHTHVSIRVPQPRLFGTQGGIGNGPGMIHIMNHGGKQNGHNRQGMQE